MRLTYDRTNNPEFVASDFVADLWARDARDAKVMVPPSVSARIFAQNCPTEVHLLTDLRAASLLRAGTRRFLGAGAGAGGGASSLGSPRRRRPFIGHTTSTVLAAGRTRCACAITDGSSTNAEQQAGAAWLVESHATSCCGLVSPRVKLRRRDVSTNARRLGGTERYPPEGVRRSERKQQEGLNHRASRVAHLPDATGRLFVCTANGSRRIQHETNTVVG